MVAYRASAPAGLRGLGPRRTSARCPEPAIGKARGRKNRIRSLSAQAEPVESTITGSQAQLAGRSEG